MSLFYYVGLKWSERPITHLVGKQPGAFEVTVLLQDGRMNELAELLNLGWDPLYFMNTPYLGP